MDSWGRSKLCISCSMLLRRVRMVVIQSETWEGCTANRLLLMPESSSRVDCEMAEAIICLLCWVAASELGSTLFASRACIDASHAAACKQPIRCIVRLRFSCRSAEAATICCLSPPAPGI